MRTQQKGPDFSLEEAEHRAGRAPVAGVDEAGRGPLAGPVVAAAVILAPGAIPPGLDDSKALGARERARLYQAIMESAAVAVAMADEARIDRDNILSATLWAMAEAVARLRPRPAVALIDGNHTPSLACPAHAIVKGDARSLSIAAASIVAKVTRDRLMEELAERYPGYGFERHKGYGTAAHRKALAALGPCPAHRRSFAPVRALLAGGNARAS